jgi:high affinity Mn2+ porin
VFACSQDAAPSAQPDAERWNIHIQGTSIGQTHGAFKSPYSGLNSLQARRETRGSLTATLFLGARLWKGGELYVNPELAGGKGLSGVLGLAGFPNGDITRVVTPTPKPYLSRLFIRQSWGLAGDSKSETVEEGPNQLAGRLPVSRFTLTLGKFSVVDMFDFNTYSHDPRVQFMSWSMMTTGTWDYPADTRGYTIGLAGELNQSRWTFRVGSFMVPRVANGLALDGHLRTNHAEVAELETRFALHGKSGKLKFMGWANHANMGNYRLALRGPTRPPDITRTRRPGTLKYGFGLNAEQALTSDIGAFLRVGWDDGKTETWAFTEIDRTINPGMRFVGKRWRRPQDALGVAFVGNGLSPDHRDYLAAGGHGFILGDGKLNPASERILETYYALRLPKMFTLTLDYQFAANPAHNKDRGPVPIWALRLHWEM